MLMHVIRLDDKINLFSFMKGYRNNVFAFKIFYFAMKTN